MSVEWDESRPSVYRGSSVFGFHLATILENMEDIRRELERLKERLIAATPSAESDYQDLFVPSATSALESTSSAALLHEVNDLRLRMVAVASAMHRDKVGALESLLSGPQRAVSSWRGDLCTFRMHSSHLLLLPAEPRGVRCWELLEGMNEFYLSAGGEAEWIVDCSGLKVPEMLVFSSLVGYRKSLAELGFGVHLVWLHPETLPPELLPQFQRQFSLTFRAGHYFSSPVVGQ